jgi:hypothetical protein
MLKHIHQSTAPAEVKKVSLLIASYALIVLLGVIISVAQVGIPEPTQTFRGVFRALGMGYIAWWLLSLDKRAWWFAVALIVFLLSMAGFGLAIMLYYGGMANDFVISILLKLAMPFYLLTHALIVLTSANTRQHFFAQTANKNT